MSMSSCRMTRFPTECKKVLCLLFGICLLFVTGCTSDSEKLEPVTKVTAQSTEDGQIQVDWDAAQGADHYRILYKTQDMQDYKYICDQTGCGYTDVHAQPGNTYRYKVEAHRKNAITVGTESNAVTIAEKAAEDDNRQPKKPKMRSVTRMDAYTMTVLWESETEDCIYEVQRAAAQNGAYTTLGETDQSAFYDDTIDGDKVYYYRVRAVSGDAKSVFSDAMASGTHAGEVFDVPVMMYHEFVTQEDLDAGVAFDEYAIWKDDFEQDLKWLKQNGYTTITCKQLIDYLNGEGTMPQKPILLTVDDGKLGVYKNAYPLLKQYGMTASLSLIGMRIDATDQNPEARTESNAPYCTWTEIKEMSDSGAVEMISHTYGLHLFHHDGRQGASSAEGETVADLLPAFQADYIRINKKIRAITGEDVRAMAYPYSKRTEVSDRALLESGYQLMLAGDNANVRHTYSNYFVREAGINVKSAVLRRVPRMNGTALQTYVQEIEAHDAY